MNTVADQVPGARGDDIRAMELLAVLSCTSRSLLPPKYALAVQNGSLKAELDTLTRRF